MPESIKSNLIPVVLSLVVGLGSSIISTRISLASAEVHIKFLGDEIATVKEENRVLYNIQTELARRGSWMIMMDDDVKEIKQLIKSSYTQAQAAADNQRFNARLSKLEQRD